MTTQAPAAPQARKTEDVLRAFHEEIDVDKPFDAPLIKTVRGHGYMLDLPAGAAKPAPEQGQAAGATTAKPSDNPTHVS